MSVAGRKGTGSVADRLLALARRIVPWNFFVRRRLREYRAARIMRKPLGEQLLAKFAEAYPSAFFVQIGSNDGVKLDPLRQHILNGGWHGILVEPLPDVFTQLMANYASCADRLIFENVAIADRDGVMPFFHLAPVADYRAEGLPYWYDALGSFQREIVAVHVSAIPDIERRIVQRDVQAITFATLCRRHDVTALDLLHTDTEGYDFELLKHVDFNAFRPRLVIFEHVHIKLEDQPAAVAYMEGHGYECVRDGMDTWCLNVRDVGRRDRRLLRLWRRLLR
jgi:FkbM family methyltransferase